MRLMVISDLHGNEDALGKIKKDADTVDVLICVGDITHFGGVSEARKALTEMRRLHTEVRAIAGNCDTREIESFLHEEGVALSTKAEIIKGVQFAGVGGALPGPIDTPYEISEEEISEALSEIPDDKDLPLVLVSHQPPYNTVADRAMKLKHVGSRSLSFWIQEHQPLLVLSGHIHESYGHKMSGPTHIINPGAFKEGRYALVDVDPVKHEVSAEMI